MRTLLSESQRLNPDVSEMCLVSDSVSPANYK